MFAARNIPRDGALNSAGQQRRARTGQRQSLLFRSIANIQSSYSSLTSKNKKTARANISLIWQSELLWRPGRNGLLIPVSELNCPIAITILNFQVYYRQLHMFCQGEIAKKNVHISTNYVNTIFNVTCVNSFFCIF